MNVSISQPAGVNSQTRKSLPASPQAKPLTASEPQVAPPMRADAFSAVAPLLPDFGNQRGRAHTPNLRFGNNKPQALNGDGDVVELTPEIIDESLKRPLIRAIVRAENDRIMTLSHVVLQLMEDPQTAKPFRQLLSQEYGIAPLRFETILKQFQASWQAKSREQPGRDDRSQFLIVDRDYVTAFKAMKEASVQQGAKITMGLLMQTIFNLPGNMIGETMRALSPKKPGIQEGDSESVLGKYSRDLTKVYESGDRPPITGRDKELSDLIPILGQVNKPNPLLIGEPGVGKTAVVEKLAELTASGFAGFAGIPPGMEQRDEDGKPILVPTGEVDAGGNFIRKPLPKRILELSLDAIAAEGPDAKKAMEAVIAEAIARKEEVILFVDEIHKMNDKNSFNNFSNQLKPYLARGDIHMIGATTLEEYRKEFATDDALARRFSTVPVDEPDIPTALTWLRDSRGYFEKKHGVKYRDDALETAVTKGKRYIASTKLPDSAFELIDRAGAKKKNESKLGSFERLVTQGKIRALEINLRGVGNRIEEIEDDLRKTDQGVSNTTENFKDRIQGLKPEIQIPPLLRRVLTAAVEYEDLLNKQKPPLSEETRQELKDFVLTSTGLTVSAPQAPWLDWVLENAQRDVKNMREFLKAEKSYEVLQEEAEKKKAEYTEQLTALRNTLASSHIVPVVTSADILDVIQTKTGIPVAKLAEDETERLEKMESELGKRVIGQRPLVKAVSDAVRKNRRGLSHPNKPIGSFLFLGPTGTGKTELAKALAEFLYGDENAVIRFDMSEFNAPHTVARFVGAPPGYVGYEEGGGLTNKVKEKPSSVVLLDEIEKADPQILDVLLQVLDDGRLTDGQNNTVSFKDTVVILTGNVGSRELMEVFLHSGGKMKPNSQAFQDLYANAAKRAKNILNEDARLRPEFLNRFDNIVVTHPLMQEHLRQIAVKMINGMNKKFQQTDYKVSVELTDEALELLINLDADFAMGARPLARAISKYLETPIGDRLGREFHSGDRIVVTKDMLQDWYHEENKA